MPLLKYTTEIDARKTAGEIQGILLAHGARAILIESDDRGGVEAISFKIKTPDGELGFKLPVDPNAVLAVLKRTSPRQYQNREQAVRVAWRIVKAWVEAQMAIIETEMVKLEEVFLPYLLMEEGKTLYEKLSQQGFYLPPGQG